MDVGGDPAHGPYPSHNHRPLLELMSVRSCECEPSPTHTKVPQALSTLLSST
eukprot:CAMPEP_0175907988 /NCGR_PEP_ID=MMETSP0108-20121206/6356_1 /TAXON_ID=195067 ORGANISM="Goniomonas pacifica, Strain CCMP1869" /NCGR_SAMPLE_ID=MMETSP0108 /ASSEMBLY_ACC=CAM_ASM_000204 /LENGTH=51 /DNA_ID=CAMNT_0017230009 /DNA_START=117 /DNA_END=272 /DNA_ORIENTATION=-